MRKHKFNHDSQDWAISNSRWVVGIGFFAVALSLFLLESFEVLLCCSASPPSLVSDWKFSVDASQLDGCNELVAIYQRMIFNTGVVFGLICMIDLVVQVTGKLRRNAVIYYPTSLRAYVAFAILTSVVSAALVFFAPTYFLQAESSGRWSIYPGSGGYVYYGCIWGFFYIGVRSCFDILLNWSQYRKS